MKSFRSKIEKNVVDETNKRKTFFEKAKDMLDRTKKYLKTSGAAIGVAMAISLSACGDNATGNGAQDVGSTDVMVVKDVGGSDASVKDAGENEDIGPVDNWQRPEGYKEVCGPIGKFCEGEMKDVCKICNLTEKDIETLKQKYNNDELTLSYLDEIKSLLLSNDENYGQTSTCEPINQYNRVCYSIRDFFVYKADWGYGGSCVMELKPNDAFSSNMGIFVLGVKERGFGYTWVNCNMGTIGDPTGIQTNGSDKTYYGTTLIRVVPIPTKIYKIIEDYAKEKK